jgi:hypothetical protein
MELKDVGRQPPPINIRGLAALKKRISVENKEKYAANSKQRLKRICSTKMRTSFIGALSQFEGFFGLLWGHGQDDPLTPEQEEMRKLWEQCRTEVLNNGNNQLRSLESEIDLHYVRWERYQMTLPVKPLEEQEKKDNGSEQEE